MASIYCLFAAGIVFGFAAIKPVLVEEGVYRHLCTKEELEVPDVRVCYQQELRLNLMFTSAAVATNVAALPVGTVLDRYGPRICSIIGSLVLAVGLLTLGLASKLPFDGYIPGYLLLALGGPFVFISSFQLSNTFPVYSGLILSILTGAFDSSSAVFLFYRLLYTATSFSPTKFFLSYLIVPVFILVVQLTIMPAQSYKTAGELVNEMRIEEEDEESALLPARRGSVNEITELLGPKHGEQRAKKKEQKKKAGVWGVLHGETAGQQIRTPWFYLITLFTVVQMTRINFFVATIRSQYTYLFGSYEKAVQINEFFDIALPLGGVCAVPFIGMVLDNAKTTTILTLLVGLGTLIGALGVMSSIWAAYLQVILFVVYRPFYYTAVSDYAAQVFGFATFGKVYGLIICLAGLCNFSQSGLDTLTHNIFHNDPVPVNLILLSIALLVGLVLVGFVSHQSRKRASEETEPLLASD